MAAAVGKYAANKMLKKEMKKYKDKHPESGNVGTPAITTRREATDTRHRIPTSPWSKTHVTRDA